jgi:hypothetical protein
MRAAEAMDHRDVDALAALLVPGYEIVPLRSAFEPTIYRRPDGLARWFAAVDDAWENIMAEVESSREGPGARGRGIGVVARDDGQSRRGSP